jgi:acetyltransferase-like isoleucine patch superfamily enzyme
VLFQHGKAIGNSKYIRLLINLIYYAFDDLRTGRFRGIIFVGIANLMPDFLALGFLRPYFWRLAGVKFADCSSVFIRSKVFVEYPARLIVGKNVHINRDSYLDSNGQIIIGDNVTISLGCRILTISHRGENHEIDVIRTTQLKDHSIVYANSTILPGSVIEKYTVISAGAVVKGRTEPKGIYSGNPASLMGFRKDLN